MLVAVGLQSMMRHICVPKMPYYTQADQEIWVATGLTGFTTYKIGVLIKV